MEQKKKALGKGLEELFSSEVLDFDTFENNIMESTPTNEVKEIPVVKSDLIHISQEKLLMKKHLTNLLNLLKIMVYFNLLSLRRVLKVMT